MSIVCIGFSESSEEDRPTCTTAPPHTESDPTSLDSFSHSQKTMGVNAQLLTGSVFEQFTILDFGFYLFYLFIYSLGKFTWEEIVCFFTQPYCQPLSYPKPAEVININKIKFLICVLSGG